MKTRILLALAMSLWVPLASEAADAGISVTKRLRTGDGVQSRPVYETETWKASETAVIVCDMWDAHHCYNAVKRVEDMAPRMNELLKNARERGALIIHAPSSCMDAYKDSPARKRAIEAPKAANLPKGIEKWMHWIDEREKKAGYPIDHSKGGEDDDPEQHAKWAEELKSRGLNPRSPWKRQYAGIEIDEEKDAITDSGVENWNLLEARGVKNVILTGVHTNMCVLGRPFGLRQLSKNGKNVVLMRDLTDTMYDPREAPQVSHFSGTDLIVEHIETYVCPTITSDQLLGGKPFRFTTDKRPHVVMLIGEKEYKTRETLPAFAKKHLLKNYCVSIVEAGAKNRNSFAGIEALKNADLLFVSVRRRSPPEAEMKIIKDFVAAGKPVVGIRTASHAFSLRGKKPPEGHAVWEKWDPEVFGGNYHGHHGNKLKTFAEAEADNANHPVLKGIASDEFSTGGSLYEVLPLEKGAKVLLMGRAETVEKRQPVAWVFGRADGGRSKSST